MKKKIASVLLALTMLSVPVISDTSADVPFSVNAEAASTEKLAKPSSLKAKISGNKVTLTWKKVSGAEGYGVYKYDADKGKYVKLKNTTKNKITINTKGEGTYKFRVYSLDKVDGKYKRGNYSYKKVVFEEKTILDDVFDGYSWGMSRNDVIEKLGKDTFVSVDDIILYEKDDDTFYCYQFKDKKLCGYGVAYEYSDSKFKKLAKLFDNDDWVALTTNPTEFTKEDLIYNGYIYVNDECSAGVMYEESTNFVMALVLKRD